MKTRLWTYSLIALLVPFFGATPLSAQTLDEELVALLESHPLIKSSREHAASSSESTKKAFSAYYPTLDLSGDAGYEYVDNPTRRAANNPGDSAYGRGRETTTLTLTQNLYNGGFDSATISEAEAIEERSKVVVDDATQTILMEAVDAYLKVLTFHELSKNSQDNENNIRAQYNLEDERVRLGGGVSVDVLESKRRLQLAKSRVIENTGLFNNALATYQKVFNHQPDISRIELPKLPVSLIPDTMEEAVEIARKENPRLKFNDLTLDSLKSRKDVVGSEYMPTVDFVFEHNYEKDKNTTIGIRRDWSVLLKANWQLFSGFSTKHGVAQASHDFEAAVGVMKDAHRTSLENIKHAWEDRITLKERIDLYRNGVNLATEVFHARKRQRDAGKETLVQVLDAEFNLYEARLLLTRAEFDHVLASYQLLFAMGRLKATDIASSLNTVSSVN